MHMKMDPTCPEERPMVLSHDPHWSTMPHTAGFIIWKLLFKMILMLFYGSTDGILTFIFIQCQMNIYQVA